ncbi:MAG: RAMP superfamily CRISPR-associated protein, partial [Acidimicrobiales bacterium]|nr:RAMP superfamily CRISPR-associated protein [Acidimicrobiales bacterium]
MATNDWTITTLDIEIETRSGLRIGGPSDRDTTDIPVHRNPDGQPIIPGSSLKGVLRSTGERILRAKSVRTCDVFDDPCGGKPSEREVKEAELCWCCQLFGSAHRAGRFFAADLLPSGGVETVVRDGVGINRQELKAQDKVKFDYEVVPPGVVFRGKVRIEDRRPGDLGLLLGLFELFELGVVGLGGGTTRGLGSVGCRVVRVEELVASTWKPGNGFV